MDEVNAARVELAEAGAGALKGQLRHRGRPLALHLRCLAHRLGAARRCDRARPEARPRPRRAAAPARAAGGAARRAARRARGLPGPAGGARLPRGDAHRRGQTGASRRAEPGRFPMPDLAAAAIAILKANDRGGYTVPTAGLYPFQWNWDSCLTALGQRHFDEGRAWTEIETLFAHQWPDGMVPHIVFHRPDAGYFPGPEVWAHRPAGADLGHHPAAGGGLCHPPALRPRPRPRRGRGAGAARCCRRSTPGTAGSMRCAIPRAKGWWRCCTPGRPGATIRSTGTTPFERVPTEGIAPYTRRDTQHADPAHRPTKAQYDRYLWLVEQFRGLGWDNRRLHDGLAVPGGRPGVQRHPASAPAADLARARRGARRGGGSRRENRGFVRPRGSRRWSGSGGAARAVSLPRPGRPAALID